MAGNRPGPQTKPTQLKVLNGNPGKRPLNDREPQPNRVAPEELHHVKPDMLREGQSQDPDTMLGAASRMWDEMAPELLRLGLLANVDINALMAGCIAWGMAVEASKKLSKEGLTVEEPKTDRTGAVVGYAIKKHPVAQIARDNYAAYRAWCQEFGLTPASRPRLQAPEGANETGSGVAEGILD